MSEVFNVNAVGYIRVSTEEQAKEGVSLDNQRAKIEAYCQYKDLELLSIIADEGVSGGKNRDREGFARILSRIEHSAVDVVVVYSLDRLSRDMLTLLAFERLLDECNIQLHTVDGQIDTSTSTGFMNYAMRAFMGEMERRQIKERTKSALEHKKSRGQVVGAVPYGWRREGDDLVENPQEQSVKNCANELYSDGFSVADIANLLNRRGYRTRSKRNWTRMQTQRLLDDYKSVYTKTSKLGGVIRDFILLIA